jgi:glycine oxidase
MSKRRSYDAVIVGGGVIGLSCAWRAAQRGKRVALVEKGRPPAGATRVAAGMLAPVGELAFGEPELLKMTLAAAGLYPGFVAELEEVSGISTGYRRDGALHVALDRDEAEALRRIHDLQVSLGLDAEWLPASGCRRLEPGLTPSFKGGVHAPGEGAVDPRALAEALVAVLPEAGVDLLFGCEPRRALLEGGRIAGIVSSEGEELLAPNLILATGAWSGQAEWLPPEGRPPVRPVKGQTLELRAREGGLPCERIVASERVYLVPRPDGRLIVGATVEEQGFDTAITAGGLHELLREAYRVLPEVTEMEVLDALAGLRPGTPDNLPFIGLAPSERGDFASVGEARPPHGLIWATGHYRNGILLAPLTGEAVAALLDEDDVLEAARAASPERLRLRAMEAAR